MATVLTQEWHRKHLELPLRLRPSMSPRSLPEKETGTEVSVPTGGVIADDQALWDFCRHNRALRIERTSTGDLILMSPTGGDTSFRNAEIIYQLRHWAKRDGRGRVSDSSGGFVLPDGSMVAPDAAWVLRSRLPADTSGFLVVVPDLVVELRSHSDSKQELVRKMQTYREVGVRVGILIDPEGFEVQLYRPGSDVVVLVNPDQVSAEPELVGLFLQMAEIWDPC